MATAAAMAMAAASAGVKEQSFNFGRSADYPCRGREQSIYFEIDTPLRKYRRTTKTSNKFIRI